MIPSMEKRRYARLQVPLEVEYQTNLPDTGELRQGKGVLRDISLSGTYVHIEDPAPLQAGQVLSLSIYAPLPYLNAYDTPHLKARGEILRIDPPGPDGTSYGVAISFLNGLAFSSFLPF